MVGAVSDGSVGNLFLEQLAGFVGRAIEPAQFWRWFAQAEAAIEQHAPDNLVDLASRIQNRFAEWSGGGVEDDLLRAVIACDAAEFGVQLQQSTRAPVGGRTS